MLPNFEAFLDATPEKGVIVVEYWWQASNRLNSPRTRTSHGAPIGTRTSMVFFKRILAADKCWCGSGRAFAKCHRRDDDWTYVSLDPDRRAFSPVVLLERTFAQINPVHVRERFARDQRWLCIEWEDARAAWALPAHPPIVNEIGQLVIGTVEISERGLRIETNSEKRLELLSSHVTHLLGSQIGQGETRRADPQQTFPPPTTRSNNSEIVR